jgi:predicted oxidoreductase
MLAWLLKHPSGILPVLGTTRPERLTAAARAFDLELSREDWFELLEVASGRHVP